MTCVIIDDEPLAIEIIVSYCKDVGSIEILGVFNNPLEAIPLLHSQEVDLLFLDIEMPQITGIEFIKTLDKKPNIVFTTAYPEFAIDGFDLNAIDYLVKPIPFPRFMKAINRARERSALMLGEQSNSHLIPAGASNYKHNPFVFVKCEYGSIRIELNSITHIQGLKDYLKIHLETKNKPILTLMSFGELEARIADNDFIRVHRSFMVNINKIKAVQKSKILINDIRIPIGEYYRDQFFERVGLNKKYR